MTTPRILALMGSGETAPTMKAPHRAIFERLGQVPMGASTPCCSTRRSDSRRTPPILAAKATEYFRDAVGREVVVAGLGRTDTGDVVAIDRGVARVRGADWVFAGPGSPTFALEQWRGTPVPDALSEKLRSRRGRGVLVGGGADARRGDGAGVRDLQGRRRPVLGRGPRCPERGRTRASR